MRSTLPGVHPRAARRNVRPPALSALAVALLLVASLALLARPTPALAGPIEAGETAIRTEDPTSVTFEVSVDAPAGLESAVLNYSVFNPDGNIGGSGVAEVTGGADSGARFSLSTRDVRRYIPVGSEFSFNWELTDADGDTVTTEEETFTFLDGRYEWQSRDANGVTVYWYGEDDSDAALALESTRDATEDMEALLDVEVPYPVKIVVWRSEREGELAMRPRGETFDSTVITGGQRVAPDLLFVFEPSVTVIRHEAAHIVTKVAGDGPFTSIPAWLDEGTAVYAQTEPGRGYVQAVEIAIQSNTPFRLRSIQSPANRAEQVNQFYGQSWSTVKFMIDEFGEEAFAEVYRLVKEGSPIDEALLAVYDVDQDGLYNLWREAHGLDPIEYTSGSNGPGEAEAQPTRPPLGIPTAIVGGGSNDPSTEPEGGEDGAATDAAADDDGGVNMAALGVAAATLLIAGALGGGVFYLARRGG